MAWGTKDLETSLRTQGFEVYREKGKIKVKGPDGRNQSFHQSGWERVEDKSFSQGIFTDLRSIGWKDERPTKTMNAPKPKPEQPTEPKPQVWYCEAEGCPAAIERRPFKKQMNISRHIQAAINRGDKAHIERYDPTYNVGEKIAPPEPAKRKQKGVTVRHVEPESPVVRMRNKAKQAKQNMVAANEAIDWIVEEYEKLVEENKEQSRKLEKLNKWMEKGLDAL